LPIRSSIHKPSFWQKLGLYLFYKTLIAAEERAA